jgi:hypothetical protein
MIQCDKLLGLGLAERRDVLEKSGLCMFCLKHSAEFECYGRGGLSKPRCTRRGCDGEHTPNVHRLMGEDDVKVSLVAGNEDEEGFEAEYECEHEYKWEYEDGGLWVGMVGAVEVLERGEETPVTTDAPAAGYNESRPGERETSEPNEGKSGFQVEGVLAEEAADDGWWDLRMGSPVPEDTGVSTVQAEASQCPPSEASRPGPPTTAKEQWARKKQESAIDQQWEEARQCARLRQVLSSGLSSEDEDEGQLGEWRLGPYEPP